ncbi:MAG: hypothetical protein RIM72_00615 [Alphaproteobacteria bacterium]
MSIDTTWIPKKSVGPIRFGDPISKHLETGLLTPSEFNTDHPDEPSFEDEDDILSVYLDDTGVIVASILTDDELVFNDINLVGLKSGELASTLSLSPDETEVEENVVDEVDETIHYFYELGLMVWLRDDHVYSVAVDDGDYEDD